LTDAVELALMALSGHPYHVGTNIPLPDAGLSATPWVHPAVKGERPKEEAR
jgi:hypothetical protein